MRTDMAVIAIEAMIVMAVDHLRPSIQSMMMSMRMSGRAETACKCRCGQNGHGNQGG
ncbi:hypothetical protein [Tardiphaga alba]|uniref:hypothetical protein n=1 Tax=Tardiphaga alba TaxID=340268 RepID=UPI001BABD9C9|nr:hypothetical protein [Tardiphaga alba]